MHSLCFRDITISWLNHTPHAIAVYASCSASLPPHATLASQAARYGLTWAGLAPADRASFGWRLRISRPFLVAKADAAVVGAAPQRQRHGEPEGLGGLEVQDHLDACGPLDGQVGRLLALEDAAGVVSEHARLVCEGPSIGHKTAGCREFAVRVDRRYLMARRQCDDLISMIPKEYVAARQEHAPQPVVLSFRPLYRR